MSNNATQTGADNGADDGADGETDRIAELRTKIADSMGSESPKDVGRLNRYWRELVDLVDVDDPACRECGRSGAHQRSEGQPWICQFCRHVPDDDRQREISEQKARIMGADAGGSE